jgi:hypothetical protein
MLHNIKASRVFVIEKQRGLARQLQASTHHKIVDSNGILI